MILKIYEFFLCRFIDNIKVYNFLVRTFPNLERRYMEREEAKIREVYIPQEELDRMTHNVWQKLCDSIPELDRSKF